MILDALPVVLLVVIAGAGPFTRIRDTAEHGQHKPTPMAPAHRSTKKETNTARRDQSTRRITRAMSGKLESDQKPRRSPARPAGQQDVIAWAAELAATMPPLTERQATAVGRIATQLDRRLDDERAA
jgi:hypothetical protein